MARKCALFVSVTWCRRSDYNVVTPGASPASRTTLSHQLTTKHFPCDASAMKLNVRKLFPSSLQGMFCQPTTLMLLQMQRFIPTYTPDLTSSTTARLRTAHKYTGPRPRAQSYSALLVSHASALAVILWHTTGSPAQIVTSTAINFSRNGWKLTT